VARLATRAEDGGRGGAACSLARARPGHKPGHEWCEPVRGWCPYAHRSPWRFVRALQPITRSVLTRPPRPLPPFVLLARTRRGTNGSHFFLCTFLCIAKTISGQDVIKQVGLHAGQTNRGGRKEVKIPLSEFDNQGGVPPRAGRAAQLGLGPRAVATRASARVAIASAPASPLGQSRATRPRPRGTAHAPRHPGVTGLTLMSPGWRRGRAQSTQHGYGHAQRMHLQHRACHTTQGQGSPESPQLD
jgi:hypothetical protein